MSKADQTDAEKAADRWLDDNFDGDDIPYGDMHTAFLAGAEWAAPKWISVKERLPEEGLEVLGLIGTANTSRKTYDIGRYESEFYRSFSCNKYGDLGIEWLEHWMPLPEPPKEEK